MVYQKSQPGSVVTFSLVAIVFVGLVIGAVWYAHQRGASDGTVPQIAKNEDKQASEPANKEKQKDTSSKDEKKAESEAKKKIESEKSDTKDTTDTSKEKAKQKDSHRASDADDSSEESTPMQRSNDNVIGSSELPETGLASDLLASTVGFIAILGSGYVYYHFGRNK